MIGITAPSCRPSIGATAVKLEPSRLGPACAVTLIRIGAAGSEGASKGITRTRWRTAEA